MPRRFSRRVPKLCHHKASGQAFAKFGGRFVYFGPWDDGQSREAYDAFVAEWLANGRNLPDSKPERQDTLTVADVREHYRRHVRSRYTASERATIKAATGILSKHYGGTSAEDFGPNRLRAVRAAMIEAGWCRNYINKQTGRIRAMFRWAASHELVSERIHRRLATVEPLSKGQARERPKVKPVDRRLVRMVRPHVSRQVRALIALQLLTGARAGELVRLRPVDLDTSGKVWTATLEDHKTAHHGKERTLYFGPKAQRVLRLFITPDRPVSAYLFSPREAEADRHARARVHRRPNQKPTPRKTGRTLGEHYTTQTYGRAIRRACHRALPFPPELRARPGERLTTKQREARKAWRQTHDWGPHRLRHNAATSIRREFGIEVAKIILGHSSLAVTQIYAEQDARKALSAIEWIG